MTIIFPELQPIVKDLHVNSVYELMHALPSANAIATCHLTKLTNILKSNSKGHYNQEKAKEIRDAARTSVGTCTSMQSLELTQTIERLQLIRQQLCHVENQIEKLMKQMDSPATTIPGISTLTAAVIYAELGDFSKFESAEKILAFAGMEPSIYQSGEYSSNHGKMVKRGPKYLRHILYLAGENVSRWDPHFASYLNKKRAESKHYNVAISHVVRRLVRTLYALESKHEAYRK